MWSVWLVSSDCGVHSVCPPMEKDKWKLPDGRDWLRGKLSLVLMGRAMFSKSLIWFSVDGWRTVGKAQSRKARMADQEAAGACARGEEGSGKGRGRLWWKKGISRGQGVSVVSFLPFHTVPGVLKARILKWLAISFSSGPHFVRTLHHDQFVLCGPTQYCS